jgi:hypothetical protein
MTYRDDTHKSNLGSNCSGRQRPRVVVENLVGSIDDTAHGAVRLSRG